MPHTPALSLLQTIEAALTHAPRHHAVVVVQSTLHGRHRWHVEIVATQWLDLFVQHLSEGLQGGGATVEIDVWTPRDDGVAN